MFTAAKPGGGTTDYVTLMMYDALEKGKHECYLKPDTEMPMVHQTDLVKGSVEFIGADKSKLSRSSYNIAGFSCSPESLHKELLKYIPGFAVEYKPDFRLDIADSWPNTIDSDVSKKDWGFNPSWNFEESVKDVLKDVYRTCKESGTIKYKSDIMNELLPETRLS